MTIAPVDPLMSEDLFQHIWQFRLFTQSGLTTLEGEHVQIDYPGRLNRHAGPDFTGARIRIGRTLWVGNVELHLKTSDWFRHGHQHNLQYRNVVLHIVFEHDMDVTHTQGIPVLELRHCIPKLLLHRYEWLRQSAAFIPCAGSVREVPSLVWTGWKDRLLIERLEQRAAMFHTWLVQTQADWDEVCYRALARGLGLPVNGELFLELAMSLPYKLLLRHQQDMVRLEALLFGQAGMLTNSPRNIAPDHYMQRLQEEYAYLRHKYKLTPLEGQRWKWLRMRPASFPSVRIATMAALLHQHNRLFSSILEAPDVNSLERLLAVQPADYWHTHYRLGVPVARTRLPGRRAVHAMLINIVLPLLYMYGREKKDSLRQEQAISFLGQLPPEDNHLIHGWEAIGIPSGSAGETQALLQLKQGYCEQKRCLECAVGARLLRSGIA
ncbi:DUF2851 family protein [Chitinophaga rhizophila]|uniref:DUF2851 family protein n=1 Tax=Chitinophaga rhizophila TaxID=2866212 RepID=A0ABS7G8I6_9BACT|nr:DUF2851 family protein [Chitinophaga rhizophila]MBW8683982.1 DUF2851 family protein [Chitinophaga rhizophila]